MQFVGVHTSNIFNYAVARLSTTLTTSVICTQMIAKLGLFMYAQMAEVIKVVSSLATPLLNISEACALTIKHIASNKPTSVGVCQSFTRARGISRNSYSIWTMPTLLNCINANSLSLLRTQTIVNIASVIYFTIIYHYYHYYYYYY